MKIRELSIKNFKNIIELHMDNIPDLVVIAGPNGCGKTSIFDAIRIFKAVVGPYSAGVLGQIQSRELRNEIRNLVNLKAEFAEITMGIKPSETEKDYLSEAFPSLEETLSQNQGLLKASIKISKTDRPVQILASLPLSELMKHYDPSDELGTFEYIPSNRDIQSGDPGTITLTATSIEAEKMERMVTVREKFGRFKYYLIMMVLYDLLKVSEEASKFMPEIKSFFKGFFPSKEFQGIDVDRSLKWHFPIKTSYGIHDVDFLSSGEKEILMTYTNILKMKLTGSVILFDEPDLHLNAALERKVIGSLKKIADAGNQVWLATHSLEIIGTVQLENLYKMYISLPEGGDNQVELCSTKRDRFEALELIGASTGIQLISQKIVFIEGKTDREILRSFFDEYSHIISFVETKGVRPLMGLSQAVVDLLDQVSKYEPFYMIRDRDLLSDAEVEEINRNYAGKVFIWNLRNIENYLLEPKILIKVLEKIGINVLGDEESILTAIKTIADDLKIDTIADMIQFEMRKRLMEMGFGLPSVKTENELLKSVLEVGETKRNRLTEQFSDRSFKELYDEKKRLVDSMWDDNYAQICDGKRMLQEFINKYINTNGRSMDISYFRNLIINQMKEMKAIPKDIEDIILNKIIQPARS